MSLDHTYETLIRFQAELRDFNEHLRGARRELEQHRDALDGLWSDEVRRLHDEALEELDTSLARYAAAQSEQFEHFIERKLAQLRQYLGGR